MATVIPWSELPDLAEVAPLFQRTAAALADRQAGFPANVRGVALLGDDGVEAAAIRVVDVAEGAFVLAQLARDPALAPSRALPMVTWGEEQARALGIANMRVSLFGAPGLGPLLAARGYALTERFLRLVLVGEPPSPGALYPGFRIVSLADVGLERFLAMSNAAFATVPGALPLSVEDWKVMARGPAYRADLLCVLADAAGPVGFARSEIEGRVGSVDALGLHPRVRGRGLGRWLLRWSGRALRAAGCAEVDLWVAESNAPAHALYLSEGYQLEKARESWELAL
jgi:ribosomal protein S18 acetylase RimI-like enzyme